MLDTLGYTIAAHTYDHANLAKLPADRLEAQISPPRRVLEGIIGHPIRFFAYPYGAWNSAAVERVNSDGFEAAFQLSDRKMDATYPLLTLRRQIVNPFTGISGFRSQISGLVDISTSASTTITTTSPTQPPSTNPVRGWQPSPPVLAPTIART